MDLLKHDRYEPIDRNNFRTAVQIRAGCYLKDYKEILPPEKIEAYDFETDMNELSLWFFEQTEDIRKGYIYYRNGQAVGMVIASLGELAGEHQAVEVNYLFVNEHARGHQVGKKLLIAIAALYSGFGRKSIHLYNWHNLKSNQFYRHIGGEVLASVIQSPGGEPLETDIFKWTISNLLEKIPVVRISWFSGTGGTQWASELLERELLKIGKVCVRQQIVGENHLARAQQMSVYDDTRLRIEREVLMYPVYAGDAPRPVYEWLERLKNAEDNSLRATIISVSGAGEVWPNTASRVRVIEKLSRKGYTVDYERMLVLPANAMMQTDQDLNTYLIQALPKRVRHIAKEHALGITRRTRKPIGRGATIWLADLEKIGTRFGSKNFEVTEACVSCGWCAASCPMANIKMIEDKPQFYDDCAFCLKCLYGCPKKAIKIVKNKWLVLGKYNLASMRALAERRPKKSVDECCKGLVWVGVKRYLHEDDHI